MESKGKSRKKYLYEVRTLFSINEEVFHPINRVNYFLKKSIATADKNNKEQAIKALNLGEYIQVTIIRKELNG